MHYLRGGRERGREGGRQAGREREREGVRYIMYMYNCTCTKIIKNNKDIHVDNKSMCFKTGYYMYLHVYIIMALQ